MPDARRLLALLDHLSTAVMVFDGAARLYWQSAAVEALFAINMRKSAGQSAGQLLAGAPVLQAALDKVLKTGEPLVEREITLALSGNAPVRNVDCSLTPVFEGARVTHVLLELTDASWRRRMAREENLLAQDHVTAALMRGMAHEVKNPLGGIRGAAQLLERELGSEAHREYTRLIMGEADRLRTLLDNMMLPESKPHPVALNVHEVLEHVRQLVEAERPTLQIHRDYDPSLPPLHADRDHLVQAFLNVVHNASQAVAGGGEITLRTRAERQVTLNGLRHRLALRVEVIDTGPGVPPEIADQIFYPMISGRADGTGLGLAITRSLIHKNGGTIECQSSPGHTVFSVLLPLNDDE
ncbi:MAG TPA: nitrogen regulation protein NR(II) [Gammaproteobacteria bacterium]|nr:nitrogen regulation protein NR(II) [Gammaproteobacteria bacterium]